MSSDVRTPPDSSRPSAADTNTSRSEQTRPPVMAMPDILAMASNGQPAPGQRVTLPSGAVWEGGKVTGTSIITLPGDDPILVAGDSSANGITGDSVQIGSLAKAFQEVLGAVPRFFANWISTGALNRYDPDAKGARTRTRVVRVSSKATLSGLAPGEGDNDSGDEVVEVPDSGIDGRTPQRFASGGMVYGPGGSRDDRVLARLSPGEFVVNAAATSNALPLLAAINGGWVPSLSYLGGVLPGFADGGLVGADSAASWRDLLRNPIAPAGADAAFRPQDFGLFGLVADALGGIGNAAINAGGAAGAALGSLIAPAFGPGGMLSSVFGTGTSAGGSTQESATRSDPVEGGGLDPMSAAMRVRTEGNPEALGFGRAYRAPIGNMPTGNPARKPEGLRPEGLNQMGSLSSALAQGIAGAATEAGGRVGAALGTVLVPALGPAGALAPEIGAQLGSLIGSKFGGSLTASMTLTGESGGSGLAPSGPTSLGEGGAGTDGGNSFVPGQLESNAETAGTGASNSGGSSSFTYGGGSSTVRQSPTGSYLVRNVPNTNGLPTENDGPATPADGSGGTLNDPVPQGDSPVVSSPSVGAAGSGAQSLELSDRIYDPTKDSFKDFLNVVGGKLGGDAATAIAPLLGENGKQIIESGASFGAAQGAALGDFYKSVDPEGKWSSSIASVVKQYTGIDWNPTGKQSETPQLTQADQVGLAALQGGISGLQQHGLVGGITGAIKGAASTVGNLAGTAAGTLLAPVLGPLAPVIGGMLGSMVAGTAAEFVTKPIELVANAAKEELGTGFGLTNLAKGPGGRTARGDIYNFNGMDPKSAAIAVERVRRRRSVAQQRGGGLGR